MSAAVKGNCFILRCSELPCASLETSALVQERNWGERWFFTEMDCDSPQAMGASSFCEITALLEKCRGKHHCQICTISPLTDRVFYTADSAFVTAYLQMCANRTYWKLCVQTRGFLNHRSPTSAAHLLRGWNMNRAFNFAL